MVRYLAGEGGANVNQAADGGVTALCIAVQQGHIEVVRYLAGDGGAPSRRMGWVRLQVPSCETGAVQNC